MELGISASITGTELSDKGQCATRILEKEDSMESLVDAKEPVDQGPELDFISHQHSDCKYSYLEHY